MNTLLRIGLGIVLVVGLVVAGLAVGWTMWGRQLWAAGPFVMHGMVTGGDTPQDCAGAGPNYGMVSGMMAGGGASGSWCTGEGYGPGWTGAEPRPDGLTIGEAREAVEQYASVLAYPDLEVTEVMEFELNFYAIVQESDTGIGAMELLVDKWTGVVRPEMGPNMMWNGRYGMHGYGGGMMMGGASPSNTIAPDEALAVAQRWLDTNRPGVTTEEHADPFYGYYTIHTLKEDRIEGMLSVHGTTGQVWYHSWHGPFIQMIEGEEGH